MPIDELISACLQSVSNSIFEICLGETRNTEEIQTLNQNVQEVAEKQCRDFFSRRLPQQGNLEEFSPSQWTPRTAESVSRIVFSEIMHIESLGDYRIRCDELMRPKAEGSASGSSMLDLAYSLKLFFSFGSSTLNDLWTNTAIVFSVGGLLCCLLGPSRILNGGLKLLRFAGMK